ncbi:MAG: hypothetical protein IJ192_01480 [Clostridia bacterium]|nr:hypothetical protein [Clostridia bacterium]
MAKEAILTLSLEGCTESIADILKLLMSVGWGFRDNSMEYLPVGDDGLYHWQKESLSYDTLFDVIFKKQSEKEQAGVVLYYEDTDIGITVLCDRPDRVKLIPDINRKTLYGDFTDVSWYIAHTAAKLKNKGYIITQIDYSEAG